ncbi:hypothetical protein ACROYT_G044691 [Oculina patagonica]
MEWENKFSSIVRETETNLARVRDRLGSSSKTKAFHPRSSGIHHGGNLRSQAARSPYKGTVAWDLPSSKHSPIKTVGMATSAPSSQASPALVNALFERVEEQAEVVSQLCDTVKKLEKERDIQATDIKKMKDEISRLNERLREKGVDIETERKLEQFKRDVYSQLEFVQSQAKLRQSAGESSGRSDSAVVNEARRIVEDETESLQRDIEHLKTKLGKMEMELHSTLAESRDVFRKQDRLDRALSSLSENQRSQSRSLSSIVDERQSDAYDIRQLKHLVNKVSHQYSELESEMQSSIRRSGVSSSNSSVRLPQPRLPKQTKMTNGDSKPRRKGAKKKTKAASDDLMLSSSSNTDLSLTTLDISSPSDTELVSLQLDRSHRGVSGNGVGNISSSSLTSLDSDDLLKELSH